jgi:hypothetical protein
MMTHYLQMNLHAPGISDFEPICSALRQPGFTGWIAFAHNRLCSGNRIVTAQPVLPQGYTRWYSPGKTPGQCEPFTFVIPQGYTRGYSPGKTPGQCEPFAFVIPQGYTRGYSEPFTFVIPQGYTRGYSEPFAFVILNGVKNLSHHSG